MPGRAALQALRPAELVETLRRLGAALGEELPPAPDGARRFAAEHPDDGPLLVEVHPAPPPFHLRRHVSLRHRNLLRLFHVGELRGLGVLVCERPSGLPLSELRAGGPLPFELGFEVLRQVAAGLGAVHQAGLAHGRVLLHNVFDREDGRNDGQVGLGPPRLAPGSAEAGEPDASGDLRQLAALFSGLIFESAPTGELGAALLRVADPRAPAPRSSFELYALLEAAAARDGLLQTAEDSSAIRLPGGAPVSGAPPGASAAARPGIDPGVFQDDGDDTTIEMERIDAAELPPFALDRSLSDLVGPLEQRGLLGPPGEDEGAGDSDELPRKAPRPVADRPAGRSLKDGGPAGEGTSPSPRAEMNRGTRRAPAPLLGGPARWLVPLGVATLLTLLLAAWVLLRGR